MKAKLVCSGVLALAASFTAFAQPTDKCIASLAAEPSLQALADKVALGRTSQGVVLRVADRTATERERAAAAIWLQKRKDCFDAGAEQRRALSTPQENA